MARFPKAPGAGAKRIGNPVYWSRMTIQNQRYKKTSDDAKELWQERYKHLWMVYDEIWEGELQLVNQHWDEWDEEEFLDLNEKFKSIGDEINENPYLDNGQLNRLKTAGKKLFLHVLEKCVEYEVFHDLESVHYCSVEKAIFMDDDPVIYLW